MTVYLRGNIYYCKFQIKKKKFRYSLRTSNKKEAVRLHDIMRNTPYMYESVTALNIPELISSTSLKPVHAWEEKVREINGKLKNTIQRMYNGLKARSKQRGISCDLTREDLENIWLASGGCCAITGIRFTESKPEGCRIAPWKPSLDRIDSSQGYTKENCRLVCGAVNVAMMDFGEDILRIIAELMILKQRKAS